MVYGPVAAVLDPGLAVAPVPCDGPAEGLPPVQAAMSTAVAASAESRLVVGIPIMNCLLLCDRFGRSLGELPGRHRSGYARGVVGSSPTSLLVEHTGHSPRMLSQGSIERTRGS